MNKSNSMIPYLEDHPTWMLDIPVDYPIDFDGIMEYNYGFQPATQ